MSWLAWSPLRKFRSASVERLLGIRAVVEGGGRHLGTASQKLPEGTPYDPRNRRVLGLAEGDQLLVRPLPDGS
jgi:hypothetical protein